MTADAIMNKIKEIVSNVSCEPEHDIIEESHLINDLGVDSLVRIEIALELEKAYSITIPDSEIEEWDTVLDIWESITD